MYGGHIRTKQDSWLVITKERCGWQYICK